MSITQFTLNESLTTEVKLKNYLINCQPLILRTLLRKLG